MAGNFYREPKRTLPGIVSQRRKLERKFQGRSNSISGCPLFCNIPIRSTPCSCSTRPDTWNWLCTYQHLQDLRINAGNRQQGRSHLPAHLRIPERNCRASLPALFPKAVEHLPTSTCPTKQFRRNDLVLGDVQRPGAWRPGLAALGTSRSLIAAMDRTLGRG